MTEHNRENTVNNNSAAVLGFVGAVIGAGVAVAASRILSDKDTRQKVIAAFSDVKKQVIDSMQTISVTSEDAQKQLAGTLKKEKAMVKKTIASPKVKKQSAKTA